MSRLVIFDDRVRGVELPGRPVLIGRSKKNDLPINDELLSRKHCSIVPVSGGYRLVDLKSSNGTYLNGERVEKTDLAADDVIEIGNTVMVFLEGGVWSRGEGLARLRNPLKAQELIGRIRLHHRSRKGEARIPQLSLAPRREAGASRAARLAAESAGQAGASKRPRRAARRAAADPAGFPDLAQALEEFLVHRAVLLLSRDSSTLRRIIGEVLAEALAGLPPPPPAAGSPEAAAGAAPPGLRSRIRAALKARLDALAQDGRAHAGREVQGGAQS